MTEQKFRSTMRQAQTMERLASAANEHDRVAYWSGYQRGLRRAYHGSKFGTAAEHKLWLGLVKAFEEKEKQRGRGYRDGFAAVETSSRMGRPPISNEPTISIGVRLRKSVAARIPAPRSEWVRQLIDEFWASTTKSDEEFLLALKALMDAADEER